MRKIQLILCTLTIFMFWGCCGVNISNDFSSVNNQRKDSSARKKGMKRLDDYQYICISFPDEIIASFEIEGDSSAFISYRFRNSAGDKKAQSVYSAKYAIRRIDHYTWIIDSVVAKNYIKTPDTKIDLKNRRIDKILDGYLIDNLIFKNKERTDLNKINNLTKEIIIFELFKKIYNDGEAPALPFYFSDGPDREIVISVINPNMYSVTFKGLDGNGFYELYSGSLFKEKSVGKLIYSSRSKRPDKNFIDASPYDIVPPFSAERNISPDNAFPMMGNIKVIDDGCIRMGDFIFRQVDSFSHPEIGTWLERSIEKIHDLHPLYRNVYQNALNDSIPLFRLIPKLKE